MEKNNHELVKDARIEGGLFKQDGSDIDIDALSVEFSEWIQSKGLIFTGQVSNVKPMFEDEG